jgi:hypothetical protein
MKKLNCKTITMIGMLALAVAFGSSLAVCQGFPGGDHEGGGGFPGGGGGGFPGGPRGGGSRDGIGQAKVDICEKDKVLCALMKEIYAYCAENGKYCEMSGLPAGQNKKGKKDSGAQPDMGNFKGEMGGGKEKHGVSGMGGGMAACMNGGKECDDFKARMKDQYAFAKKAKEVCETKDAEVCAMITDTDTFCLQNQDICYPEVRTEEAKRAREEQQNPEAQQEKKPPIQFVKNMQPYKELLDACLLGGDKCAESKNNAKERLQLLNDTKTICAKNSKDFKECDSMLEATAACTAGLGKCKELRETKALCRENPEECEKLKEQSNESAIDGLKVRCKKNTDICMQNITQKRSYCTQNPAECDKDTLHMLDEMEAFIAQLHQ